MVKIRDWNQEEVQKFVDFIYDNSCTCYHRGYSIKAWLDKCFNYEPVAWEDVGLDYNTKVKEIMVNDGIGDVPEDFLEIEIGACDASSGKLVKLTKRIYINGDDFVELIEVGMLKFIDAHYKDDIMDKFNK